MSHFVNHTCKGTNIIDFSENISGMILTNLTVGKNVNHLLTMATTKLLVAKNIIWTKQFQSY